MNHPSGPVDDFVILSSAGRELDPFMGVARPRARFTVKDQRKVMMNTSRDPVNEG